MQNTRKAMARFFMFKNHANLNNNANLVLRQRAKLQLKVCNSHVAICICSVPGYDNIYSHATPKLANP